MATKACASCLRTFERHSRKSRLISQNATSKFTSSRMFTTSSRTSIILPEPNASPAMSMPPVHPGRAEGGNAQSSPSTPAMKAAQGLKNITGNSTETYTAYGATEALYHQCAQQAAYTIPRVAEEDGEMSKTEDGEDLGVGEGWWLKDLGLKPTFSTWSQVTMLHMYLLSARIRDFPAHLAQPWQQHLLDHFFYDAENRMTINHNMHARGTRNKYLKDLFVQWRGLLAAYDEGVVKSDAVLAAAVWRNIFKASEEVDVKALAQIVSYVRRVLAGLDNVDDMQLMQAGIQFGSPGNENDVVTKQSAMMDLPFGKAPGKDSLEGKRA